MENSPSGEDSDAETESSATTLEVFASLATAFAVAAVAAA